MKRGRRTPEQAVRKVREGGRILGAGSELVEMLRHFEITESTWAVLVSSELCRALGQCQHCTMCVTGVGCHL